MKKWILNIIILSLMVLTVIGFFLVDAGVQKQVDNAEGIEVLGASLGLVFVRILLIVFSIPCLLWEIELFSGIYFLICGKHRDHKLLFGLHVALIVLSLLTFAPLGLAALEIPFISSNFLLTLCALLLICATFVGFTALVARIVVSIRRKRKKEAAEIVAE